jgi:MSHA biogenesis protein MshO
MSRHRGFTLIEVIVAMVLLGFLAVVGSHMIGDSMRTASITANNQASGSQARFAVERMTREIRELAYGSTQYSITTKTATTFAFTKEDGTAVTITCPSSCGSATNAVTMTYAGTTSTLTDQVPLNGLAFEYLDQFGATTTSNADIRLVQITLSVTNSQTSRTDSFRTKVLLRNAQSTPT